MLRNLIIIFGLIVLCLGSATMPAAQYYKQPISDLDAEIMQIDEDKFLGAKLNGDTMLIGSDGERFALSGMFGKPLLLVLAYYTCDGSCSVINNELAVLFDDVKRVQAGDDFRILTLSFDKQDNLKTTAEFTDKLDVDPAVRNAWRFATFENEADLETQTANIGFKFFWSPQDKVFLHPGAFLFFSPEGRLIRILYPPTVEAKDVELAVLDAKQGQFRPQEIIDFAVSLCYSYNYAEGKYTLSIPVIVGFGALGSGLTLLFASIFIFKSKKRKAMGEMNHAHMA